MTEYIIKRFPNYKTIIPMIQLPQSVKHQILSIGSNTVERLCCMVDKTIDVNTSEILSIEPFIIQHSNKPRSNIIEFLYVSNVLVHFEGNTDVILRSAWTKDKVCRGEIRGYKIIL